MQKLVKKSTDKVETPWGLDWFVQAGHGGSGNRNCTLVEDATLATPAYPFIAGQGPTTTWVNSGVTPKGNVSGTGAEPEHVALAVAAGVPVPADRVPQRAQEPAAVPRRRDGRSRPRAHLDVGHHGPDAGVARHGAAADRRRATPRSATPPRSRSGSTASTAATRDTSRGAANNWDCSVPGSRTQPIRAGTRPAQKLIPAGGAGTGNRGHNKTLEALKWMAAFHPERQLLRARPPRARRASSTRTATTASTSSTCATSTTRRRGSRSAWRRSPATAPRTTAASTRSCATTSTASRPTRVGGTTYGGTGVYGAQVGGVWDALLGEGRNFWFFASSDWHNRGSFGPDDRRTTQDFYPGEYQRNYTLVRNGADKLRPQTIVDGLRTGNTFATSGQIIDRLGFVACIGKSDAQVGADRRERARSTTPRSTVAGCATMGEKLVVPAGSDIVVGIAVRDPAGTNYSPYTFPNPSLLQVGINQPLNMPVLDHIDLIGGLVTGYKTPGAPDYAGEWPRNTDWLRADGTTADLSVVPAAAKNISGRDPPDVQRQRRHALEDRDFATSTASTFLTMTFRISAVTASQYVRLRGTNLPAAVPFETDASGNPLADVYTNASDPTRLRIPCTTPHSAGSQFDGCPDHLATATGADNPIVGQKAVSFDVAAWADLWFYSNPIYIEVTGSTVVAGVK